ncbi:hypothetical protein Leryth_019926 [Lithospermum erythrorhizon]|nr:hypothetical protein Leryth_019926 [Lithospermum erythrorhizon]
MEEQERIIENAKQEIWSWGAGTEGQLGTKKQEDEHHPQLIHSLASFGPIFSISCGGAHVIAITHGGRVLTWGRGTSGQLGHGEMCNSLQPKLVESLQSLVITHVSAGWNHSGFVSDTGCLFTCGDGSFGQLGHGDFSSQCIPTEISYFNTRQVLQIACGMRHSLALLKGDQVFGFGSGKRGQLGISNDIVKSVCVPHKTLGLEDVNSMNIIANGDHSAALCSRKHLYIWGRGFNGAPDQHTPRCIETSFSISQAAIGWSHVLVLTGEGKIFMLGGYLGGALNKGDGTVINQHSANSEPAKEELMQEIDGLDNIRVQQIAAGAEHSAIVTENGSVMTCGWGEHGQLGLGNAIDQTVPQTVHIGQKLGNNEKILRVVYCGSGFTYTINKYSGNSHM